WYSTRMKSSPLFSGKIRNLANIGLKRREQLIGDRLKYRGFFHGILAETPAAFFFGALTVGALGRSCGQSTSPLRRAGRMVSSIQKPVLGSGLVICALASNPKAINV